MVVHSVLQIEHVKSRLSLNMSDAKSALTIVKGVSIVLITELPFGYHLGPFVNIIHLLRYLRTHHRDNPDMIPSLWVILHRPVFMGLVDRFSTAPWGP